MRKWIPVFVVLSALAVAGCASRRAAEPPPPDPNTQAGADAGATTSGAEIDGAAAGDAEAGSDVLPGPMGEQLSKRIVYFDYDRDELRPGDAAIVSAHGRYLADNPNVRVRLEGHTDERGTREYNIGLGERRSQAVRRALLLQGVTETQLSTVSYGEERPAAAGSDEDAWAQNRRVEIVYVR